MKDSRPSSIDPEKSDYTYYINICKDVHPNRLPRGENVNGPLYDSCIVTHPGDWDIEGEELTGPSPAFQVAEMKVTQYEACHRLGKSIVEVPPTWGLYDERDPSQGVYIEYDGGDQCDNGKSRSLRITIECDPSFSNQPEAEVIFETEMCSYEIQLRSANGCPLECALAKGHDGRTKLCSDNGICGYDAIKNAPRCFCNPGYTGESCSERVDIPGGGLTRTGSILLVVGLFLIFTLCTLVYLWLRIRSLRLDPTAYTALRGGPAGEEEVDTTV